MADKRTWTPEPWWDESGTAHAKGPAWTEAVHSCVHPINGQGQNGEEDDCWRACECVNACEGMMDPVKEIAELRATIAKLPDRVEEWILGYQNDAGPSQHRLIGLIATSTRAAIKRTFTDSTKAAAEAAKKERD